MIQLAYPAALLALIAIPIILALYLLRPQPRRVVLSTTALWQEALRERERGLGLRRLFSDLSLLLLIAAAVALGLALAGPQWLAATSERADTVLVLDVSASMKTRSGIGATRFDQALAAAADIVAAMPREGRMLVMTSGRRPLLRTGFESDRAVLARALSRLRAGDEAGRPREALALALSLISGRESGRVYFITDGGFDADVDPGSPQVVYRIVGGPARNVAITRFDVRQEPSSEERFQVLMTVRNFTDQSVAVPATVTLEERALFSRTIELEANAEQRLVVPLNGRAAGRAIARIEADDDLAADNQAFAALSGEDTLHVLLYTGGNFYLESVLAAVPGVRVVKRRWSESEDLTERARLYDVVVLDGVAAPRLPPGNFLLVNSIAPELPFADAGTVARPRILGHGTSALMRDVDLTAVRIAGARRVTVTDQAPGLQRLFWSKETDLALALLAGDLRVVYLGFDLAQSNLPLQLAFPLFISHSLQWLRPRGDGFTTTHMPAGAVHWIQLPPGETHAVVRAPSGDVAPMELKDGTAQFDATHDAGIYQVSVAEATRYFAVSLADARESDLNNRWRPDARSGEAGSARDAAQALRPLWPYLLAIALVLLALEWGVWTWSRRSA